MRVELHFSLFFSVSALVCLFFLGAMSVRRALEQPKVRKNNADCVANDPGFGRSSKPQDRRYRPGVLPTWMTNEEDDEEPVGNAIPGGDDVDMVTNEKSGPRVVDMPRVVEVPRVVDVPRVLDVGVDDEQEYDDDDDDDEADRRRARMRARMNREQERQEHDDGGDLEPERATNAAASPAPRAGVGRAAAAAEQDADDEGSSDYTYETEESDEEDGAVAPMPAITFVPKSKRATIAERDAEEWREEERRKQEAEQLAKRQAETREQARREAERAQAEAQAAAAAALGSVTDEARASMRDASGIDTDDESGDADALFDLWHKREMSRLLRDLAARERYTDPRASNDPRAPGTNDDKGDASMLNDTRPLPIVTKPPQSRGAFFRSEAD